MSESTPEGHGNSVAVYSKSLLEILYDNIALGFNMRYMWRCPTTSVLIPFFIENFSDRHLDCGVGTGYFVAEALKVVSKERPQQRLVFLDASANCLEVAEAHALAIAPEIKIESFEGNVKEQLPKPLQDAEFDSISMFNLFHCVPGPAKLQGLRYYADRLSDEGVLSGCSVLGRRYSPNWISTLYLRLYNWRGKVMYNLDDTEEEFEVALKEIFEDVEIEVVGMMILFTAKKPRRS